MSNWSGTARSNYFRVRDEIEFLRWVDGLPGVTASRHREDGGRGEKDERFCLLEEGGEGWPSCHHDEGTGDVRDMDIVDELWAHLAEGEVAGLQESGAEKLRYVTGYAVAVNSRGEILKVDIDDIYERVREAGWDDDVTHAAY